MMLLYCNNVGHPLPPFDISTLTKIRFYVYCCFFTHFVLAFCWEVKNITTIPLSLWIICKFCYFRRKSPKYRESVGLRIGFIPATSFCKDLKGQYNSLITAGRGRSTRNTDLVGGSRNTVLVGGTRNTALVGGTRNTVLVGVLGTLPL